MRHVSVTQLYDLTGVDRRTIKDRLAGLIPRKEGKALMYDAREALPLIMGTSEGDAKRLLAEELRYQIAQADKLDLQVQQMRGELIPAGDVSLAAQKRFAAVRGGLLAISTKVASELSTINDPIEIKAILDDRINETLEEINDAAIASLSYDESDDPTDPEVES